MSEPLLAAIPGRPGPKGSVRAVCVRCGQRRLPQKVVITEQSEVGIAFRKTIRRALARYEDHRFGSLPIETVVTVYIERERQVKGGVTLETYVPTSSTPRPMHRNSGDIEKHVRVLHDALQDAGVLADDCLVTDLIARKRWATAEHPAGIEIEIRHASLDD